MTREVSLTKGRVAVVDEDDYVNLTKYKWYYDSNGYAYRRKTYGHYNSKLVSMHREVLDDVPNGLVVDHINRDKLDNRKSNLRAVTQSENAANSGPRTGGSSTYKGVHWSRQSKRWVSKIEKRGEYHTLGFFKIEEHAALAYNLKAVELFGDCAYLNKLSITEIDPSLENRPSSMYLGVTFVNRVSKWRAYIGSNSSRKHLGYFTQEYDAAKAYNESAIEIYGDAAKLNEIERVV